MIRISLRSLLAHKLRAALTVLAIMLGVAMISGTYVLTDQINAGFDSIFKTAVKGTDVIVGPRAPAFGQQMGAMLQYVPDATLRQIQATPGVAKAAGFVAGLGAITKNGKVISVQNGPPTLLYSEVPPPFTQNVYTAGGPPRARGEVSLSAAFAAKHDLKPGASIGVVTSQGARQVRLVGTFNFGSAASLGGATVVLGTLPDMQEWLGARGKYSAVYAAAAPGVSPKDLAARIRQRVPAGLDVKTGQQSADEQGKAVRDLLGNIITPALLAFGALAVLVGAFIIFNAFSMTVAQRLREFAMLRALGASRRQVLGVVVVEAFVIGLTASVAGLFVGLGVARGVNALLSAVGSDLPSAPISLQTRTIVVGLLVGMIVTMLAALVPALRATRVPPVAALQEGATLPPSRFGRLTPYLMGLLLAAGAAMIVAGSLSGGSLARRLLFLGVGALLVFVAAGMAAKYAVRPLAAALGWPLERLSHTSGRLARENAARNPARTGATAAALMIGLAVVVFVAVFAQAIKASFVDVVDRSVRADLIVTTGYAVPLPPGGVEAIRRVPWAAAVSGVATQQVKVAGAGVVPLFAVDPTDIGALWRFQWLKGGSDRVLGRLGPSQALVEQGVARDRNLRIGERFSIMTQARKTRLLTMVGEMRDPVAFNGIVVSNAAYDQLFPTRDVQLTLIKVLPGVSVSKLKAAAQQVLQKAFPTATVQTKQEYVDFVTKQVNQLLMLLYALLAMSVIISLFGIVNTLVLSVYERTREIGMLRAIGASRRQIRRMVRYESVITAVIGGLLGIGVGVVFAFILISQLGDQGITFALPATQLLAFLLVSAFVGVLAAVLPARRAARVDILDAIHYE